MDKLNADEQAELLRYYIPLRGNPPYIQDARFRDLFSRFEASDERNDGADVRVSPAALDAQNVDESVSELTPGETNEDTEAVAPVENHVETEKKSEEIK